MSLLGKLAFWKKKDEFGDIGLGDKGMGSDFGGSDLGIGSTPSGPESPEGGYGLPTQPTQSSLIPPQQPSAPQPSFQPQFQPPPPQQQAGFSTDKDLEVISSKLDALRAALDSINQRLANLEAIARGGEEQNKRRYYRY